jgi:hypothetical protein
VKNVLTALLLMPLASFAQPKDDGRLKELAESMTRQGWHQCLARRIQSLDDNISPASDIATAVRMECATEFERFVQLIALEEPATASTMRRERIALTREAAITITLELRAMRQRNR